MQMIWKVGAGAIVMAAVIWWGTGGLAEETRLYDPVGNVRKTSP
jgi:hypothetical protein